MKGDFSRDTFNPANHFSRVLTQQGRVQLDADSNEQAAILLHYLQALAADLIGPHGGPQGNLGFGIMDSKALDDSKILAPADRKRLENANILPLAQGDFLIGRGHYYVNGLLCENEDYITYKMQAGFPFAEETPQKDQVGNFLVYLDVWERHLTYLELEDPDGSVISPREVALGGPDTATRAQIVWQVKTSPTEITATNARDYQKFLTALGDEHRPGTGLLKARAIQPASTPEPCNIPPDARYRGAENQLYRVEVHLGGTVGAATFKWSRENGAVIFAIRQISATQITLEGLGHDARLGLQAGDWVEIVDDDYTLQNRAAALLQVDAVDYDESVVTLKAAPDSTIGRDPAKHPLLRRWDQRAGDARDATGDGLVIVEGERDQNWIELEDGIEIQFQPGRTYRSGDYWLIPARIATGDVEWPGRAGAPAAVEPRGIMHHYAPLWKISVSSAGAVTADDANSLRLTITPIPLLS
ncbi:MAG: DUF6519 domain-containing protein [Roseiflexaceae bacterium]